MRPNLNEQYDSMRMLDYRHFDWYFHRKSGYFVQSFQNDDPPLLRYCNKSSRVY